MPASLLNTPAWRRTDVLPCKRCLPRCLHKAATEPVARLQGWLHDARLLTLIRGWSEGQEDSSRNLVGDAGSKV